MEQKNKIYALLDEKYVKELFAAELMPKYQSFKEIKRIRITTPKNHIWEKTYHMVIKYRITFLTNEDIKKRLTFYAVAHSDELRENVYDVLKYLWDNKFNKGYSTIPHPVFYSSKFNASFYRGVDGEHLRYYLSKYDFEEVEKIVVKTAKWFAKLHNLKVTDDIKINERNNRIETVVPGVEKIYQSIKNVHPEMLEEYQRLYSLFIEKEDLFFASTAKRYLVHGDAHPENVIRMSEKKVALIDFADTCLGDYTRDLGTFMQQFEFMSPQGEEYMDKTTKIKELFLETYFAKRKITPTAEIMARIDNYYNWTMLRTATYFFIKEVPRYETGLYLLNKLRSKLL